MRRIGNGTRNAGLDAVLDVVEAFSRAACIIVNKRTVALIDVRGQKLCSFSIGAGDDQCRNTHDVGSQTGSVQVADMRRCRDQNLAAEMAALLFRSQAGLRSERQQRLPR